MIADLIIIALIIVFALIGMRRGIGITILNIAGIIVTAIAAYYLSGILSDFIYDTFLHQTITQNLQQIVSQSGLQYAAQNCFDSLPDWVNGILSFIIGLFGISISEFQKNMQIPQFNSVNGISVIENSIKSVVTSAFDVILLVLLAIIIFIIVKLIVKRLSGLFKLPVIKQMNKLLGGMLGIAEGIVFVFIAVNIFYAVVNQTYPELFLNSLVSGNVFKFFCILY